MAGDLKVANIQGLSPGFTVELDGDSVLEVEGDLRLQGQSYAPIPGGPDNEKPLNPKYGSTWMNTWTGKLEYWKGPGKGGWDYINPGTAGGAGAGGGGAEEEPPPPIITNAAEWTTLAQDNVPILMQTEQGGQETITPVMITTQNGSKMALNLGSAGNISATWFPGNGYYSGYTYGRSISNTVQQNFQKFGYIFSGQRIAVTSISGTSESCCDWYRYEYMFGSSYTPTWPNIYGNAGNSQHQPYETNLQSFSSATSASTSLTLRYRTDGSVNSGPGFYSHTPNIYLYIQ